MKGVKFAGTLALFLAAFVWGMSFPAQTAASEVVLGRQTNGLVGRACDVFFILGLLFCTAVTMCISLPTVEAALEQVFGIKPSFTVEIVVLIVSAGVAAWSVWSGLNKGIKVLSDINVIVALGMVAYGALCGPTASLFDIFTNAFGKFVGNFWDMNFWTSPFSDSTFPRDWTIFYALFWAGYGPFMGLFIARISRGRTVREVIAWGLVGTCAGGYLIHGVFASYTLYIQYHGILDAVSILKNSGGPAAMMAVLDTLPFGKESSSLAARRYSSSNSNRVRSTALWMSFAQEACFFP